MSKERKISAERVSKVRRGAGLSQQEFAERLGVSRNYVSMLERGAKEVSANSSIGLLFRTLEERIAGGGQMAVREEAAGYPAPRSRLRMIPVLGWAHAGAAVDYEQETSEVVVPTECPDPKAFAVTLEGDSMYPLCDDGDMLVLMPSARVYSGCYVVGRFAGSEGVIFRRLEVLGEEEFVLVPENERYQARTHRPEDFTWLCPVWGSWTQLWNGAMGEEEKL